MLVTFLGWYRAKKAQNLSNSELHYVAPLNPYAASVALGMGITAIIFIGFDTFQPFKVQSFVTSYFAVPYALVFFVGGKIIKKTKFVDPASADLISGKREVDAECREWEEGGIEENWKRELAAMSFWKRCWERIW
jgi:amino acid transporter